MQLIFFNASLLFLLILSSWHIVHTYIHTQLSQTSLTTHAGHHRTTPDDASAELTYSNNECSRALRKLWNITHNNYEAKSIPSPRSRLLDYTSPKCTLGKAIDYPRTPNCLWEEAQSCQTDFTARSQRIVDPKREHGTGV